MGAKALIAVFGHNTQPRQSGDGNGHRSEVHRAMGEMHVGGDPPLLPEQQAITRLVERVLQRGAKLGPRRILEDGLQEVIDRGVVAAAGFQHRQSHAATASGLGNKLRRQGQYGLLAHRRGSFCEHRCVSNHLPHVL